MIKYRVNCNFVDEETFYTELKKCYDGVDEFINKYESGEGAILEDKLCEMY